MIETFSYDYETHTIISELYDEARDEYGAPMIIARDVPHVYGPRLIKMLNHFVQSGCERHMSQTPTQLA